MRITQEELGQLVKMYRVKRDISQKQLADLVKTNRSAIAHLEQGLRVPESLLLIAICKHLEIPAPYWEPFTDAEALRQLTKFDESLTELVGETVTLSQLDNESQVSAENQVQALLSKTLS